MITKDKFYINGQWTAAAAKGSIDVHSPTDGALLARIPQGTAADAEAAIGAACRAFDAWAATPPARRAELLKKIQEGLKARTDEIARTISLEMGMPYKLSQRIQVGSPTVAFPFGAKGDNPLAMYLCDLYTIPTNLAGHPGMSVPFGTGADGLAHPAAVARRGAVRGTDQWISQSRRSADSRLARTG